MPRQAKPRKRTQKVSPGLKGFADARKAKIDVLRDVRSHVVAEGTKNADVGREPHLIHVSDVIKSDSCVRKMTYKVRKQTRTDNGEASYHRLEMIWAAGHDAHHKWQRWFAEMGELWGNWTCRTCESPLGASLPPEVCSACGENRQDMFRYDEVNLGVEEYYLVGHADGALPKYNALIEVKSFSVGSVRFDAPNIVKDHTHKIEGKQVIDHEGVWKAIKRPLRSHLLQGLMYLWIAKQMGMPYDRIVFIYENKTTQDTKTFEVTLSLRLIQPYLDTLEQVVQHVQTGTLPDRPKLFAKDSKPCSACPFRTECWGESDSSTASAAVPGARQSPGGEAADGGAEVPATPASDRRDPRRARRHHRAGGPRPDRDDDAPDQVGRAPRRPVGNGRGGRALGRGSDGQGEGPRFPRRGTRRNRA